MFDLAIIGGGIVGLATALRCVTVRPDWRVVVLEKEAAVGAHQTGHNSGVIHSGLYYRPGSARARFCAVGSRMMRAFCEEHGIRVEVRGKVVVATRQDELAALDELHRRGLANGVDRLTVIGPERLREIEPHAAGLRALHVPGAAVVDFSDVASKMAELAAAAGVEISTKTAVKGIKTTVGTVRLDIARGEPVEAKRVVTCAGLYADRLARKEGARPRERVIPFRGEYYALAEARRHLCRGLIYPVPDLKFPFLGVHFTRDVNGEVEAGPNAVLALAREGYRKDQVSPRDLIEILTYRGFWRLAARHWKAGAGELKRSFSRKAFVRALARLVPDIRLEDVRPAGAGVRAQVLAPDGHLVDDLLVIERPPVLHVCNAVSPAATSALAIAEHITQRVAYR